MPVKKDASGKRWVEVEAIVPGTPEQVWDAIATGSGYTSWFTPTTIEERVGGEIRFDLGEHGESKGEVTEWAPPGRFGYVERNWAEGAPPLATEITVTARSGDRCVIRMVHSLFASSEDWDDQMEGFENGWRGFLIVLRLYLAHYPGMKSAIASASNRVDASPLDVWKRFTGALGLNAADVGEERAIPDPPENTSAIVEHIEQNEKQRFVVLRLTQPAPAIVLGSTYGAGETTTLTVSIYHYGDDAVQRAQASTLKWRKWLAGAV